MDRNRRRSWKLIDRGKRPLPATNGPVPAMQGGALCIPFGEKSSLHKKTKRENQGLGSSSSRGLAVMREVAIPWTECGRSRGFCQHCPWEVDPLTTSASGLPDPLRIRPDNPQPVLTRLSQHKCHDDSAARILSAAGTDAGDQGHSRHRPASCSPPSYL